MDSEFTFVYGCVRSARSVQPDTKWLVHWLFLFTCSTVNHFAETLVSEGCLKSRLYYAVIITEMITYKRVSDS